MSELTYERAKQLYTPYDEGQMRHLCALRDVEIDRLRVENAKLRELCEDVWHLFTEHGAVHPCDLPVVDAVREHMRELGVEVVE